MLSDKNYFGLVTLIILFSIQVKAQQSIDKTVPLQTDTAKSKNTDTDAPVVMANLTSNFITRNKLLEITVNDISMVSVDVFKDGQLMQTSSNKKFAIQLSEGTHTYVIKAKDQFGHTAADFILQNITQDSFNPLISSNLQPNYFFSKLPQTLRLIITASEALSELTINGNKVQIDESLQKYIYDYQVTTAGLINFNISAKDFAGNPADLRLLQTTIDIINHE